ncbi:unnamed protein product [Cuscuta campestris]|uniref:RNase H type-1 domain-containing protein n=1 Tax=Cuscuta campestris TaxID=132261 RepID=A0A484NDV0_9ASTE|nr:unnamed protein product [Cuscuta campestris]
MSRPEITRCFIDAAVFEQNNSTSVAAALLDNTGSFVGGFNKLVSCPLVPRYVETVAIKEALSWLKEKNIQEVSIFSDCAQAVHALKNGRPQIDDLTQPRRSRLYNDAALPRRNNPPLLRVTAALPWVDQALTLFHRRPGARRTSEALEAV